MIISFDFDGSLSRTSIQNECKALIKAGYEVHVVTQRANGDQRFYGIVYNVGVKDENIHFTGGEDKYLTLDKIGADVHYDNDARQILLINHKSKKTVGVLI